MSVILDALKKLQREKSQPRERTEEIAAEILRPDSPSPRKRRGHYFATLGLTAMLAVAITYAAMVGLGRLPRSPLPSSPGAPEKKAQAAPARVSSEPVPGVQAEISQPPPAIQRPSEVQGRTPPAVPPPSSSWSRSRPLKPTPSPVVLPPEPSGGLPKANKRAPREVRKGGESKPASASPEEKKVSRTVPQDRPIVPGDEAKIAAKAPPSRASGEPPPLKLSGILWQEKRSERQAVINGNFVREGGMVEGVKVLEIHPTHVTLSYNGRSFEISIHLFSR